MRTVRLFLYFLVGVLLSAASIVAYAGEHDYPAVWTCDGQPGKWSYTTGCFASESEACNSAVTEKNRTVTNLHFNSNTQRAYECRTAKGNYVTDVTQRLACPGGGSLRVDGQGVGTCVNPTPCAEGETRNPETGMCEPVQCESGELNSAPGGTFLSTSSYCSGGCGRTADWYRMADGSTSAHIKGTGSACTPGPEPDPDSCTETSPDFLGYVNEQPFCGPGGGNGDGEDTGGGETGGGETGGGETGGGETGGGETGGGETGGGETGGGETGGGETGGGETGGGETGGGETGGGDAGGGGGTGGGETGGGDGTGEGGGDSGGGSGDGSGTGGGSGDGEGEGEEGEGPGFAFPSEFTFYEQKYEKSLGELVTEKMQQIGDAPVVQLIDKLTTGPGGGGSCPSWSFSFNLGAMGNYGSMGIAPPCWIWAAIKTIMIITSLFAARRIVFGG